jgi:hypothetical protein
MTLHSRLSSPFRWPVVAVLLSVLVLLPGLRSRHPSNVAARLVREAHDLLQDGAFEADGSAEGPWRPCGGGFERRLGEGRGGGAALRLASEDGGAVQVVDLSGRPSVGPLVLRGWSRSRDVSGQTDADYSLYVDIEAQDGSRRFGLFAPFAPGTHDWEEAVLELPAGPPVRTLRIHCLFRHRSGEAWFDDLRLEELKLPPGGIVLEGVPAVPQRRAASRKRLKTSTSSTRDGLLLRWEEDEIASVVVDGKEVASEACSGFMARDVAAGSDVLRFVDRKIPELDLALRWDLKAREDHLEIEGAVRSTLGRDRAVTLYFAVPLSMDGWTWEADPSRREPLRPGDVRIEEVAVGSGATGTMSRYPLAAVSQGPRGLAIAVDPEHPQQARLLAQAGTGQLMAAMDLGIPAESAGEASFRLRLYRFDGRHGFRGALDKAYGFSPDAFRNRMRVQGTWMPFTDIRRVRDWQDFGFRFHEGLTDPGFDEKAGILAFRYSEPMMWWMPMAADLPRTEEAARAELRRRAELQEPQALAVLNAGMSDARGQKALRLVRAPWCDGAVWSLNPGPDLPGRPNAASLHWTSEIRQKFYDASAPGPVAGEFVDSVEGYAAADLDFDRAHVLASRFPPTFDRATRRPVLLKSQPMFEYLDLLRRELASGDRCVFGNGVPERFAALASRVDVFGMERDWMPGGRYRPPSEADLLFWRAMARQRPFHLLLNTDFATADPADLERFFQRALSLGMFPSMFSPNASDASYWERPEWYERDRPMFRRYIPLIQRLGTAGWQPVTRATSDAPGLRIERFGPDAAGHLFLTLHNPGTAEVEARLRVEGAGPRTSAEPHEWVQRRTLAWEPDGGLRVAVGPLETRMLEIAPSGDSAIVPRETPR